MVGWNGYLDPTLEYGYLLLNTRLKTVGIRLAVVLRNLKDDVD